jgi:hypothetical protein
MEATSTASPFYSLTASWIPHSDFPFCRVEQKATFSGVPVKEQERAPPKDSERGMPWVGSLQPIHTNNHPDSQFQNWQSHLMGIHNSGLCRPRGLVPGKAFAAATAASTGNFERRSRPASEVET